MPLAQNGGTVAPSLLGQQGFAIYTGSSFTGDQYAQAKLVTNSSVPSSTGVCVRMNVEGSGVCYLAAVGAIYVLANGAGTHAMTFGCPVAAIGDTFQLLVVGTTYTCTDLTTGVSASATDNTYLTGSPAILVDQRRSTIYTLTQFQADCSPSCGMVPAAYPVADAFSGYGGLSASWTGTTSSGEGYVPLVQNAGTVTPSVVGQQGLAIYTGASFTSDQYAQAKFVTHSSALGSTGVCVRMSVAGSGVCYLGDWGLIYALSNGAGIHPVTSGCPVPASGDTIRLLVVGTTYTCTDVTTGVSISATDTTYSTGNPAILVDQRKSTVYTLAQFQADCSPSCSSAGATPSQLVPAAYPAGDAFSGYGGLSANWADTTSPGEGYVPLAQNAGTVAPSVLGQQGLAIYTGTSFTNDQYAQARFVTESFIGSSTGVCVRMNVAGSGVCYLGNPGKIYALANGAGTHLITSGCPIPASGDVIQLLVVGTTYTCIDVTTGLSASATDTTFSTGSPGILVDQRRSTVYTLAQFQADCSPSCGAGAPPVATPAPAFNPQLTVSAASLSFGNVTVNTAKTQTLTLTSSGTTPVTVNSVSITGAGFSILGGSFPVTLDPTQTLTLQLQFDPTTTGSLSGQLTINSNSSNGSTTVVTLSGTGTTGAHEVDLSWYAPASSPDPVVGYNIYRATSGGSLVRINTSPDPTTVYVDNTVVSGATYSYVVKSVDYGGLESIGSNQITVTIP